MFSRLFLLLFCNLVTLTGRAVSDQPCEEIISSLNQRTIAAINFKKDHPKAILSESQKLRILKINSELTNMVSMKSSQIGQQMCNLRKQEELIDFSKGYNPQGPVKTDPQCIPNKAYEVSGIQFPVDWQEVAIKDIWAEIKQWVRCQNHLTHFYKDFLIPVALPKFTLKPIQGATDLKKNHQFVFPFNPNHMTSCQSGPGKVAVSHASACVFKRLEMWDGVEKFMPGAKDEEIPKLPNKPPQNGLDGAHDILDIAF